jgi:hypothetical protein
VQGEYSAGILHQRSIVGGAKAARKSLLDECPKLVCLHIQVTAICAIEQEAVDRNFDCLPQKALGSVGLFINRHLRFIETACDLAPSDRR